MKHFIIILCIAATSCGGTQKQFAEPVKEDIAPIQNPLLENIPVCVNQLIEKFTAEEKQNPPRKIYRFTYQGKTVYYVTAPCCDFFSDLYDSDCQLMGHPDGGITGRGDGKLPDFEKEKSHEKLIWEDQRK
jgi:hypothetical protein